MYVRSLEGKEKRVEGGEERKKRRERGGEKKETRDERGEGKSEEFIVCITFVFWC